MLEVLLNNQYKIPITTLQASYTLEKFVSEIQTEIALSDEKTEKEDIYNIADFLNEQRNVICVYVDGQRYFTGFVTKSSVRERRTQYSVNVTLKSKTIDLLESTYIPIRFDKVNGGANFLTNGKIDFLQIVRITLQKLKWIVVDPNSSDADRRFTEYNVISIINKTDNAKKPIILDNKKGEAAVQRVFVDGTSSTTTIKSLKPSPTESCGRFLMRLANELGLILTTNADGDIVIEDASVKNTPETWQKFTKKIFGDTQYNNIAEIDINNNYEQIYNQYFRLVNDADEQNTPESSVVNGKITPKISINDNARITRHQAYSAGETVNMQKQIAMQEMMAKTMAARSEEITIVPISHRYTTIHDLQPNPIERKLIEAGDAVFLDVELLLTNEVIDNEIMYISEVSMNYSKEKFDISVKLVKPDYYSNPSIRPRKQLLKQRKLSTV